MKMQTLRAALCAGAIAATTTFPAQAALVTFDDIAPNAFGVGDTFVSGGFNFRLTSGPLQTVLGLPEQPGFGIVDTFASLSIFSNAPTGNATQFYAGLNDNAITLTAGGLISVTGFSFGFVPPVTAPGASSGYLLAAAWLDEANAFGVNFYDFGLADNNGDWAFISANTATPTSGSAMPTSVRSVTFVACQVQGSSCFWPANNQGQFALDNIRVDAIPLPGSWLLAGLGLAGLAVTRRRPSHAVAR